MNPQGNDDAIKNVVNIYSYNQMHFEDLCIEAKRIFKRFKPRMMVVDGNGMGTGFVDYLVKDQIDPVSGELLPNMGIVNDEPGIYKQFKTKDTILDSVYVIKATAQLNTEMHAHISNQMRMNKIKFLIDEREAKERLLGLDKGQKMSLDQRAEELRPYVVTSIMKEELLNLRQKNEGFNIILEQVNKKIRKDKFSALEYALWYIKQEEDKHRKRKKIDLKKMIFFN